MRVLAFGNQPPVTPTEVKLKPMALPVNYMASKNHKQLLFSTDYDDTLAPKTPANTTESGGLQRNLREVAKYSSKVAFHLNTGRGLLSIKEEAPLLKGAQLDYLSLNNGQQLYVNTQHHPAEKWIPTLSPDKQDTVWQHFVEKLEGWKIEEVVDILKQELDQLGFKPYQHPGLVIPQKRVLYSRTFPVSGERLIVEMNGDQPVLSISSLVTDAQGNNPRRVLTPWAKQIADRLLKSTLAKLPRQDNVQLISKDGTVGANTFAIYALQPSNIDKSVIVDYLLRNYFKNPHAVITAGDHEYNDTELLTRREYRAPQGRTILNYPILSGTRPAWQGLLGSHPRVEYAPAGDLGAALERQMDKQKFLGSGPKFVKFA